MESCSPRNVAPGLSAAYSISYAFIRSTMMSEPYSALERPDVAATRSTAWTSWPSLIVNLRSAYVESAPSPHPLPPQGGEERVEGLTAILLAACHSAGAALRGSTFASGCGASSPAAPRGLLHMRSPRLGQALCPAWSGWRRVI